MSPFLFYINFTIFEIVDFVFRIRKELVLQQGERETNLIDLNIEPNRSRSHHLKNLVNWIFMACF